MISGMTFFTAVFFLNWVNWLFRSKTSKKPFITRKISFLVQKGFKQIIALGSNMNFDSRMVFRLKNNPVLWTFLARKVIVCVLCNFKTQIASKIRKIYTLRPLILLEPENFWRIFRRFRHFEAKNWLAKREKKYPGWKVNIFIFFVISQGIFRTFS